MVNDLLATKSDPLTAVMTELDWLAEFIDIAICAYLEHEGYEERNALEHSPPELADGDAYFTQTVQALNLDIYERTILALALAPHFRPELLDIFLGLNKLHERPFTEFGGVQRTGYTGFLPSIQTACFLLSSMDVHHRHKILDLFNTSHPLLAKGVIELGTHDEGLPEWHVELRLGTGWAKYFRSGELPRDSAVSGFPAQPLTTPMSWADIVLTEQVSARLAEARNWLKYRDTLWNDWALSKKLKPGYRMLFHGPPGTGKTLAATLVGQSANKPVYRINLAHLVSKYIGETEKNLEKVFDIASSRDWILFFDEADSLFGKRTETHNSNDRFANQQTGYLLQRVEDYPGLVILATNLRANLDEAFTRRFQQVIYFAIPDEEERIQLWRHALKGKWQLAADVNLLNIARDFELTGGSINNILQHVTLSAVARSIQEVTFADIKEGIRREYMKDNRTF